MATINSAKPSPVNKTVKTQALPTTAPKSKLGRDKEVGSLWLRTPKGGGDDYMTGEVNVEGGKIDVIVFKNSYKEEGSKQPDYRIYIRDSLPTNQ